MRSILTRSSAPLALRATRTLPTRRKPTSSPRIASSSAMASRVRRTIAIAGACSLPRETSPAEREVAPEPRSLRSSTSTSVTPLRARCQAMLQPSTPPPTIATEARSALAELMRRTPGFAACPHAQTIALFEARLGRGRSRASANYACSERDTIATAPTLTAGRILARRPHPLGYGECEPLLFTRAFAFAMLSGRVVPARKRDLETAASTRYRTLT